MDTESWENVASDGLRWRRDLYRELVREGRNGGLPSEESVFDGKKKIRQQLGKVSSNPWLQSRLSLPCGFIQP